MPYVTSIERFAMERGMKQGRQEGEQKGLRDGLLEAIAFGLKLRFGEPGLELLSALRQVQEAGLLRCFHEAVFTVETLDQLRGKLPRS